jgi:hypothetical protein
MRRQQTRLVDGWIGNLPLPPSFLHRRCRPPLPRLGDQRAFQVSLFCPSASLLGSLSSPSCAAVGSGEERRVRGR